MRKELAKGLVADYDGFVLWLSYTDKTGAHNVIGLEPFVMMALCDFRREIVKAEMAQGDVTPDYIISKGKP